MQRNPQRLLIREISLTEFSMNKFMKLKDPVEVPRSSAQHIFKHQYDLFRLHMSKAPRGDSI